MAAIFLALSSTSFSQTKQPSRKKPQTVYAPAPAVTCASPGPYSECMIVMRKDLILDEWNYIVHAILGKGYTIDRPVRAGESNLNTIIVEKGTPVDFFRVDPNSKNFEGGSLQKCVMGQANGLHCWGFLESISFPKGTVVAFNSMSYPSNGNARSTWDRREVRVDNVILGADCNIPNLGVVKKGTRVSFEFLDADPNVGRATIRE